jgi:hypothetical protein
MIIKSFSDVYTELSHYLNDTIDLLEKHKDEPYLHKALKKDLLNQIWHFEGLLKRFEQAVYRENEREKEEVK